MAGTLIAPELPELHVHRLHVTFDVVFELRGEPAEVAKHLRWVRVVQRHVAVQAVPIPECLRANLAHECIVAEMELHVRLQTERRLAFGFTNLANSLCFVLGLNVFVLRPNLVEHKIADEAFVVEFVGNFVLSFRLAVDSAVAEKKN